MSEIDKLDEERIREAAWDGVFSMFQRRFGVQPHSVLDDLKQANQDGETWEEYIFAADIAIRSYINNHLTASGLTVVAAEELERLREENDSLRAHNEQWQSLEVMRQMADEKALEGVLDAFSMEESLTSETFKSYLQKYPQYVVQLSDLYHEINLARLEADALTRKGGDDG